MSVGAAGPLVVTYIDDAILHPIAERFGVEVVIEVGRGGNDSGFGPAPSGLETPLAAPGGCLSRLGFAAKADSDRPRLGLGAAERVRRFQKALDTLRATNPNTDQKRTGIDTRSYSHGASRHSCRNRPSRARWSISTRDFHPERLVNMKSSATGVGGALDDMPTGPLCELFHTLTNFLGCAVCAGLLFFEQISTMTTKRGST